MPENQNVEWKESWGRGIQKIKDSCDENGNSFPEYRILPDEISVEFKALNDNVAHNVVHNVARKDRKDVIIKMIRENPVITRNEIANKLGVSVKTVERAISDISCVKYTGSGSSGHWEIIENLDSEK